MKHLKTPQELNKASENLNISDNSSLNSIENAKKFLKSFYWNIEEYDEGGYLGIDETELAKILVKYGESLK